MDASERRRVHLADPDEHSIGPGAGAEPPALERTLHAGRGEAHRAVLPRGALVAAPGCDVSRREDPRLPTQPYAAGDHARVEVQPGPGGCPQRTVLEHRADDDRE